MARWSFPYLYNLSLFHIIYIKLFMQFSLNGLHHWPSESLPNFFLPDWHPFYRPVGITIAFMLIFLSSTHSPLSPALPSGPYFHWCIFFSPFYSYLFWPLQSPAWDTIPVNPPPSDSSSLLCSSASAQAWNLKYIIVYLLRCYCTGMLNTAFLWWSFFFVLGR